MALIQKKITWFTWFAEWLFHGATYRLRGYSLDFVPGLRFE